MTKESLTKSILVVALLALGCRGERRDVGSPAASDPEALAPLFADLGDFHYSVTASEEAQRFFDQALTLSYAFNHAEAIRSFREAGRLDPQCAMCPWGVALALGPNINAPMDTAVVPDAMEALRQAKDLASRASEREQRLIAAVAARYVEAAPEDRSELDQAYAAAMREVARDFPEDADIQTLYAEALMDTTAWSYWLDDGSPKPETEEILTALEAALALNPSHIGALHLYIHTVEASADPYRGESIADRLGPLVPGAGHLVHMPSHIYLRVGRYEEASTANELAALADESYIAQCNAQGFYPALYYPHNIHFLWFSAALEGRQEVSTAAGRKVAKQVGEEMARQMPQLEAFLPVPLFSMVRFGDWEGILAYPRPSEELIYLTAMWHYARGLAHVAGADLAAASAESAALEEVAASEAASSLDERGTWPGTALVSIAHKVLAAQVAGLAGGRDRQIAGLEEAVAAQDELDYMEPPYWYYPVRQTLGRALLDAGRAGEAEVVYRQDLERVPRNGWSLHGLARSLEAQGKTAEAAEATARFDEAWARADYEI
ncbi:MAG: hypothetical protein VYE73_18285 [Acidobacteriota bacterium]|nr:hypothetical protein [Acidobacteriota bacterium]